MSSGGRSPRYKRPNLHRHNTPRRAKPLQVSGQRWGGKREGEGDGPFFADDGLEAADDADLGAAGLELHARLDLRVSAREHVVVAARGAQRAQWRAHSPHLFAGRAAAAYACVSACGARRHWD